MAENQVFSAELKKAMALCAGREMCLHDIRQKLITKDLTSDEVEKILNLLKEGKFIDEERFAMAYSKDKFKYNKWGKIKIAAGLKMKKIPQEVITRALSSIDETEYTDLLKSIILRQQKSVRAKNQYDMKGKILRHCLSKGFESYLVYDLLREDE
jgi:regulatory protein